MHLVNDPQVSWFYLNKIFSVGFPNVIASFSSMTVVHFRCHILFIQLSPIRSLIHLLLNRNTWCSRRLSTNCATLFCLFWFYPVVNSPTTCSVIAIVNCYIIVKFSDFTLPVHKDSITSLLLFFLCILSCKPCHSVVTTQKGNGHQVGAEEETLMLFISAIFFQCFQHNLRG